MKLATIIGLYALGAITLSAIGSSSAVAVEYGVCAKASKLHMKYTGKYAEKNCRAESEPTGEGKYEWVPYPGPAGTKWGYTSKAKPVTLKGEAGNIVCKSSTDEGVVTGVKTGEDQITFSHCVSKVNRETCQSGATKGEVVTKDLATVLLGFGEVGLSGKEPAPGEVWTEFVSEEGPSGVQVAFECAGIQFSTTGSLSGVDSDNVNVMSTKGRIEFSEGAGEQDLISAFYNPLTGKTEEGPSEDLFTSEGKAESKTEIKAP